MAKKKASKKAAGLKYPKKKAASATRTKLKAGAGKKAPRSQVLPGMERVRNTRLDGYCEDARDGLQSIEDGTSAVNDAKQGAMKELQKIGRSSYVHSGVRFTHTPGVDKVSVKRIKETEFTGASPASPEKPAAEGDGLGDGDEGEGGFSGESAGDIQ